MEELIVKLQRWVFLGNEPEEPKEESKEETDD